MSNPSCVEALVVNIFLVLSIDGYGVTEILSYLVRILSQTIFYVSGLNDSFQQKCFKMNRYIL